MNVATVVEGPTDHLLLEAIILHWYPHATVIPLQPPTPHDQSGTGWRGVKRWCQSNGHRLEQIISADSGPPLDLLIIQVDADIARQNDLQRGVTNPVADVLQSCPPITPTVERLRQVLLSWLGMADTRQLPIQTIFAIPSQDIENWIFASLFPNDALCQHANYECIHTEQSHHPAHLLTTKAYAIPSKRTMARYKDGKIKKQVSRYRPYISRFANGWTKCCQICTQAHAFENDVVASLAQDNHPDRFADFSKRGYDALNN